MPVTLQQEAQFVYCRQWLRAMGWSCFALSTSVSSRQHTLHWDISKKVKNGTILPIFAYSNNLGECSCLSSLFYVNNWSNLHTPHVQNCPILKHSPLHAPSRTHHKAKIFRVLFTTMSRPWDDFKPVQPLKNPNFGCLTQAKLSNLTWAFPLSPPTCVFTGIFNVKAM